MSAFGFQVGERFADHARVVAADDRVLADQ
jgi:hypothetical protein